MYSVVRMNDEGDDESSDEEFVSYQTGQHLLVTCPICCDQMPSSKLVSLSEHCNHIYCISCWTRYIDAEAKKGSTQLGCPECGVTLDLQMMQQVTSLRSQRKLSKNNRKHSEEMLAISDKTGAYMCGQLWLGSLRWLLCGWACPQTDGCAPLCNVLTCLGFCCDCCCTCCCNRCNSYCDFVEFCNDRPYLNWTCFGNNIELCPRCHTSHQITGGCPNLTCKKCHTHWVRDQQFYCACCCCVTGSYCGFLNYNACCGEGTCCEVCFAVHCCVCY